MLNYQELNTLRNLALNKRASHESEKIRMKQDDEYIVYLQTIIDKIDKLTVPVTEPVKKNPLRK